MTAINYTQGEDGWTGSDKKYMNQSINGKGNIAGILSKLQAKRGFDLNGDSYVSDIDTVSGATCSSITVRAAVNQALIDAAVAAAK